MQYNREIDDNSLLRYIILYVFNCVKDDLRYDTLINIITDACNINYLEFQICLSGLEEAGFVGMYTTDDNQPMYTPTEKGLTAAPLFEKNVPIYIRNPLKEAIKARLKEEFARTRNMARIVPVSSEEYAVELKMLDVDNTPLLTMQLLAGAKENAIDMCEIIEKNPDEIYMAVIQKIEEISNK